MSEVRIDLSRDWDWRHRHRLVQAGPIEVETFQFPGGTLGLRISTDIGEVTMLPFQGQQVWDAVFHGRSLTMKTMFDGPRDTTDYMRTYGGLLIHCGATAMGPPGKDDDHPPHGELPNAPFDSAHLLVGSDARGDYVVVSGEYRHTVAFQTNYVFRPSVRITASESVLDVTLEVENLKQSPMELMYLAHANLRPVDGSQLIDNATRLKMRQELPSHVKPSPGFQETFDRLMADPEQHRQVDDEAVYDPEMVFFLEYDASEAINLARHPDGGGDFIRYPTDPLRKTTRWISRTGDQDCLGLALPATAEPEGRSAERAKGNVLDLVGGATWRASYSFGSVDAAGAEKLVAEVEASR